MGGKSCQRIFELTESRTIQNTNDAIAIGSRYDLNEAGRSGEKDFAHQIGVVGLTPLGDLAALEAQIEVVALAVAFACLPPYRPRCQVLPHVVFRR
jgi:hypothetical protein